MAKFSCLVSALRTKTHIPLTVSGSINLSRKSSLQQLSPCQTVEYLQKADSTELVPGDIFSLERGMKLPCDAILLFGNVSSVLFVDN